MSERLRDEIASLLAEHDESCDPAARNLLRARLAMSLSEGLRQGEGARGDEHSGEADHTRLAAFLDAALPRSEREAVAARLADDPALRAEVASAVALLDEVEAQPNAPPAGLVARAAALLAASDSSIRRIDARGGASAWRHKGPVVWSSIAAVALLAVAIPAVVFPVLAGRISPPEPAMSRGLAPPAPAKRPAELAQPVRPVSNAKDRVCDDTGNSAGAPRVSREKNAADDAPAASASDDACRPAAPTQDGKRAAPSAERN
jgi:hypothetical protein